MHSISILICIAMCSSLALAAPSLFSLDDEITTSEYQIIHNNIIYRLNCNSTHPSLLCVAALDAAWCVISIAPKPHTCMLPPLAGGEYFSCQAHVTRWFHNHATGECEEFSYGGCGGNDNKFYTKAECEAACSHLVSVHWTKAALE